MTVEQILKLHEAGFDADAITKMSVALETETAPVPAPADPAPADPAPAPQPTAADPQPEEVPAWFGRFMTAYNRDMDSINTALHATNVRRAGSGDPGAPMPKTPEQLMAEAYANIR